MISRSIGTIATLVCVTACLEVAGAQPTELVAVDAVPSQGPDIPWAGQDYRRFVFDLRGSDDSTSHLWTGSEIAVDVLGSGGIWHASDQNLGDPNGGPVYPNNLSVPAAPVPPPTHTSRYDTFLAGDLYQIGPVPPNPNLVGIVSSPTRIRGLFSSGQEGPLPWSTPIPTPLNNTTLARFTFQVPAGLGLSLTPAADYPSVFARLVGRTFSSDNVDGTPFDLTIYQAPEPASAVFVAAAGLTVLLRGSRRFE